MDSVKDTQQHEQKDKVSWVLHCCYRPEPNNQYQGVVDSATDSVKATFEHHKANPGPAVPKDFSVAQEGTKEERLAKAKELNK